jgi:hypothetical protein
MSFKSNIERLRDERLALEASERAEMYAAMSRIVADTEAAIARSRPSIQQALRENLDVELDYDEERRDGWVLDSGKEFP